jgi:hypothetical protein|tara:strand:- start:429 stop:1247 length:819 start_codon:yes stop_codon:yes gene_type:complete
MIDRKELAEELLLRENIRRAIGIVSTRLEKQKLLEQKDENQLREIIRSLLEEGQSAVAAVAKHDSTGINALEDLLKNTNVLSVLETGYKSLTTDPQQRESYKNHILSAIQKSLAPEESRKEAGEDVEITEEIDIAVGDRPEDDPDFIDVEEEEVVEEPDPKEEFGLNGEDKTGRNRAFTDFQNIEKVILTAFDDLDNPEDITLFEEYLLKNISLYFEKYESELDATVPAPAAAAATADADPELASDETDIPEFALEEVLRHLDVDDIIENLL